MKSREHYLQAMALRKYIREFFALREFVECETPICVRSPGMEPNLVPFETVVTEWSGAKHQAGLITSPEYSLKKLLGAGLPRVFELARVFRNHEALDATHNPEFTMLEWYRADATYEDIMRDTEELVRFCSDKLGVESGIWNMPWQRLTVDEAFRKYVGFSLLENFTREQLAVKARELGIEIPETDSFDDIFFRIFGLHIERKLGHDRPVILYEYPASQASLARLKSTDSRVAERFEVYIKGVEIANAFGELTDAAEQRKRFAIEAEERRLQGKTVFPIDEDLLSALQHVRSASGIALGVDRLAMILIGANSLEDVLAFSANELFNS
jgi:lysyl-tRNA synthetase class 2